MKILLNPKFDFMETVKASWLIIPIQRSKRRTVIADIYIGLASHRFKSYRHRDSTAEVISGLFDHEICHAVQIETGERLSEEEKENMARAFVRAGRSERGRGFYESVLYPSASNIGRISARLEEVRQSRISTSR